MFLFVDLHFDVRQLGREGHHVFWSHLQNTMINTWDMLYSNYSPFVHIWVLCRCMNGKMVSGQTVSEHCISNDY